MITGKRFLTYRSIITFIAVAVVWMMGLALPVNGQRPNRTAGGTIAAGTTISVRTNEEINTSDADGRVFSGIVDQDVTDRNGNVAIPRRSEVELIVKQVSDKEVAVDLDAITVNGQRFGIETEDNVVDADKREGVGANSRTGKYVGGGAVLGAIIGGIAGGAKGAAIGAGAGAAAGAGTQVLTRGGSVKIPVESLLTFRLEQPLRAGVRNNTVMRNGVRYRPGYDNVSSNQANQSNQSNQSNSPAYVDGMRAGRSDRDRNQPRNTQSRRWTNAAERRDYEAGYNQAYQGRGNNAAVNSQAYEDGMRAGQADRDARRPRNTMSRRWSSAEDRRDYEAGYNQGFQSQVNNQAGNAGEASVKIGSDNNVTWRGPQNSHLYVQVDNNPQQTFASGGSGTQLAPWIESGHTYVFILKDDRTGREIARDELDLRSNNRRRP